MLSQLTRKFNLKIANFSVSAINLAVPSNVKIPISFHIRAQITKVMLSKVKLNTGGVDRTNIDGKKT